MAKRILIDNGNLIYSSYIKEKLKDIKQLKIYNFLKDNNLSILDKEFI